MQKRDEMHSYNKNYERKNDKQMWRKWMDAARRDSAMKKNTKLIWQFRGCSISFAPSCNGSEAFPFHITNRLKHTNKMPTYAHMFFSIAFLND